MTTLTAAAPTPVKVTTWADGFGVWHAAIEYPYTADTFRATARAAVVAARRAIRAELSERGDLGKGYRVEVDPSMTVPITHHAHHVDVGGPSVVLRFTERARS